MEILKENLNKSIIKPMPNKQKGVALMMVLFVFALVTILASGMISRQSLFIKKASNILIQSQAYEHSLSAEQFAKEILFADWEGDKKDKKFIDDLEEEWAQVALGLIVDHGVIEGQLDDLQGRLNINSFVNADGSINQASIERFNRLLTLLSLPGDIAEKLVDWIDENDELEGANGAEDGEYLVQEAPYRTGNQAFQSISELRLIIGIPQDVLTKLSPHLVALPTGFNSINVNTCSIELIQILAKGNALSVSDAQEVIDLRPFETVEDFRAVDQFAGLVLNGAFSVNSEFFKVSTKVTLADRVSRLVSILYRDSENGNLTLMERNQGQKYLITKDLVLQQ